MVTESVFEVVGPLDPADLVHDTLEGPEPAIFFDHQEIEIVVGAVGVMEVRTASRSNRPS